MKRKGKNTSNSCLFVCLFFLLKFIYFRVVGVFPQKFPRDFKLSLIIIIIKCLHSLTIRIRLIAATSTLRLSRSQLNPRLLYKLLNKLQVNLFRASGSYFSTLLSQLFLKAQDFPTFRQLLVFSWVVFSGLKRLLLYLNLFSILFFCACATLLSINLFSSFCSQFELSEPNLNFMYSI